MRVRVIGGLFGAGLAIVATQVTGPSVGAAAPPPPPLPPGVDDPNCVRAIGPGDSLSLIADAIPDEAVTVASLQAENGIGDPDRIEVGTLLDVCVGNLVDDVTGEPRSDESEAVALDGVEAQQQKLNDLFVGTGLPELAVDGVSGPLTRQQLCAARMALGLPISRANMEPGSAEEQTLFAAEGLRFPATAVLSADRWIVIDKTCQVLFAGEGDRGITFVFRTSTGEPGWETTNQERVRAFRYNPAADNEGWHDSSRFPAAEDNPLNGNMYRPIYFHRGQAIHGSNNVPPEPKSKGCARLHVVDQDALVAWLGLGDLTEPIWDPDRVGVTVTVQGEYAPDDAPSA